MGRSVYGYLFFGYAWDDEVDFEEPDVGELATEHLAAQGVTSPFDSEDYPDRNASGHYDWEAVKAWRADHKSEIDDWLIARQRAEREIGVGWDSHGSGEWSVPFVYVYGTETSAEWGGAIPIDSLPDVTPEQIEKLNAHLDQFGIERPEPAPRWHLAAYGD